MCSTIILHNRVSGARPTKQDQNEFDPRPRFILVRQNQNQIIQTNSRLNYEKSRDKACTID